MDITTVICEFNPLHFGHLRLLSEVRSRHADTAVVAVMSGDFTQRGDMAVFGKYSRAAAAVECGFDLVLELPYPFCCAPAENFAMSAVSVCARICADRLIFGSESGDIAALSSVAERTSSREFNSAVALGRQEHTGESEIRLRNRVYNELYGDGTYPTSPNDILAVEYINAARRLKADHRLAIPLTETVARQGEWSATAAREAILAGIKTDMLPAQMVAVAEGEHPLSVCDRTVTGALLGFWRFAAPMMPAIDTFAGMGGGMSGRLIRAAASADDMPSFIAAAATKKYTTARIRRAILHGAFGTTAEALRELPRFTTVLAASERGRAVLRGIRRPASASNPPLYIYQKSALAQRPATCAEEALRLAQANVSARASSLRRLGTKK